MDNFKGTDNVNEIENLRKENTLLKDTVSELVEACAMVLGYLGDPKDFCKGEEILSSYIVRTLQKALGKETKDV